MSVQSRTRRRVATGATVACAACAGAFALAAQATVPYVGPATPVTVAKVGSQPILAFNGITATGTLAVDAQRGKVTRGYLVDDGAEADLTPVEPDNPDGNHAGSVNDVAEAGGRVVGSVGRGDGAGGSLREASLWFTREEVAPTSSKPYVRDNLSAVVGAPGQAVSISPDGSKVLVALSAGGARLVSVALNGTKRAYAVQPLPTALVEGTAVRKIAAYNAVTDAGAVAVDFVRGNGIRRGAVVEGAEATEETPVIPRNTNGNFDGTVSDIAADGTLFGTIGSSGGPQAQAWRTPGTNLPLGQTGVPKVANAGTKALVVGGGAPPRVVTLNP